jgi:hypothetical protein
VATHAVEALRCEADVAHHGDVDSGEGLDRVTHHHSALELDALGALLHQADRALDRLLRADLVRTEREIADDEGTWLGARHQTHVVHHVVERYGNGVGLALHDHADRVADQDHVDTGKIDEARKR